MALISFKNIKGYYYQMSELYLYHTFLSKFILKMKISDNIQKIYLDKFNDSFVFFFFKNSLLFAYEQLSDLTCVDWVGTKHRFELVYVLLSLYLNKRIVVSNFFGVEENNVYSVMIPSVMHIFLGANWLEREVWDMFGIFFFGHVDLRRILTDYGFRGFPLRKDFPMSGFLESRYDDNLKVIVSEKIVFMQVYRIFDFTSPWERI